MRGQTGHCRKAAREYATGQLQKSRLAKLTSEVPSKAEENIRSADVAFALAADIGDPTTTCLLSSGTSPFSAMREPREEPSADISDCSMIRYTGDGRDEILSM